MILLVYPVALCVLMFWGVKLAGKKQFNDDFLSQAKMKAMQVFACISIILHHLTQEISGYGNINVGPITPLANMGILFTAIFFFASGFGLLVSYENKDNYLDGFMRKRLSKILVPFFIVNGLMVAVKAYEGVHYNGPINLVKNVVGIKLINGNSWYIIEILILYIAFFLVFKIFRNENIGIGLIAIIAIAMMLYAKSRGHGENLIGVDTSTAWFVGEWWYNTTFVFVFGMIVARFRESITEYSRKHYKGMIIAFSIGLVIVTILEKLARMFFGYYNNVNTWKFVGNSTITMIAQTIWCMVFVAWLLLINMKVSFENKAIVFLGGITLEMYLSQRLIIDEFHEIIMENPIIGYLLVLICTFIMAYAVSWINKLVQMGIKRIPTIEFSIPKAVWVVLCCGIIITAAGFLVKDKVLAKHWYEKEMDALESAEVGDIVEYGRYNIDSGFGKEDLRWIVLFKNENRCILVTENAIKKSYFHNEHEEVNWECSTLRQTLNDASFLSTFSKYEMESIKPAKNGDYVSLLSEEEAKRYFETDQNRKAVASKVAIGEGVNTNSMSKVKQWDYDDSKTSWWWLRGSGYTRAIKNPVVNVDGEIVHEGEYVNVSTGAVRPRIEVSL